MGEPKPAPTQGAGQGDDQGGRRQAMHRDTGMPGSQDEQPGLVVVTQKKDQDGNYISKDSNKIGTSKQLFKKEVASKSFESDFDGGKSSGIEQDDQSKMTEIEKQKKKKDTYKSHASTCDSPENRGSTVLPGNASSFRDVPKPDTSKNHNQGGQSMGPENITTSISQDEGRHLSENNITNMDTQGQSGKRSGGHLKTDDDSQCFHGTQETGTGDNIVFGEHLTSGDVSNAVGIPGNEEISQIRQDTTRENQGPSTDLTQRDEFTQHNSKQQKKKPEDNKNTEEAEAADLQDKRNTQSLTTEKALDRHVAADHTKDTKPENNAAEIIADQPRESKQASVEDEFTVRQIGGLLIITHVMSKTVQKKHIGSFNYCNKENLLILNNKELFQLMFEKKKIVLKRVEEFSEDDESDKMSTDQTPDDLTQPASGTTPSTDLQKIAGK